MAVSLTGAVVVAAWALGWWLEPLYGDLTRLGSYSERDFGWNRPIEEFEPPSTSFGEWTKPVDILVIGDSFANLRPAQQWQNHLAANTGWSIHTLDINDVDVESISTHRIYLTNPPKVVIWNVVERDLLSEYGARNRACPAGLAAPAVQLGTPDPSVVHKRYVERSHSIVDVNPAFSRAWIVNAARRAIFNVDTGGTVRADLAVPDLFSSFESGQILIYRQDTGKSTWQEADLVRIRCAFASLASRFQANGNTAFVTALAPDKSSAYRPWLLQPERLPEAWLPRILEDFPVPDARLDRAVLDALSAGTKDVYMPNDTHWGSGGQKIAADAVLSMLERLRISRRGLD